MDYTDIKKIYKSGLLMENDSKENILNKKFDVDMFYTNDYYKHKTYNDYNLSTDFLQPFSNDKNYSLFKNSDSDSEPEDDTFNDKYIDKYLKTREDKTFQKKLENLRILNKNKSKKKTKKVVTHSGEREDFDGDDLSDSEKLYCDNIIKHLKTCQKCKDYVLNNFNETSDDLMNIAIYSITGIFIIMLLDLFFKKGMKIAG